MVDVEMDGFGNALDEFERDAGFKLFGVDGVCRPGVGDQFERDERGELREDVGRGRNALVDDRVKDRHETIDGKRFGTKQLGCRRPRTFVF